MTATATAVDYDPFAPDFYTSDPFGVYRWMRDEAPVYRSEQRGWYARTRLEDVRAAALDADTFRSFEGMDIDDSRLEQVPPGSIGSMDNPRHDQVRSVVQPFSGRGLTCRRYNLSAAARRFSEARASPSRREKDASSCSMLTAMSGSTSASARRNSVQ